MRLHPPEAQGFRLTQILALHETGLSRQQIATACGCSQSWVSQVLKRARLVGKAAVRPKGPAPGRQPALTAADRADLLPVLLAEARASGFATDGWTCPRIAQVIEARYGVRHRPAHVSRLLRQLGFSRQKPAGRDYRRDEAQVVRWKEEALPALKKSGRQGLRTPLCR